MLCSLALIFCGILKSSCWNVSVVCCDIVDKVKTRAETSEQFHSPSIDDGMYG